MEIPAQYQGKEIVAILQNPSGCYYAIIPQSTREIQKMVKNESSSSPRLVTTFRGVNIDFLALADRYAENLNPKAGDTRITLQDILDISPPSI